MRLAFTYSSSPSSSSRWAVLGCGPRRETRARSPRAFEDQDVGAALARSRPSISPAGPPPTTHVFTWTGGIRSSFAARYSRGTGRRGRPGWKPPRAGGLDPLPPGVRDHRQASRGHAGGPRRGQREISRRASPGPGQDAARWIIAKGVRLAGNDPATFARSLIGSDLAVGVTPGHWRELQNVMRAPRRCGGLRRDARRPSLVFSGGDPADRHVTVSDLGRVPSSRAIASASSARRCERGPHRPAARISASRRSSGAP